MRFRLETLDALLSDRILSLSGSASRALAIRVATFALLQAAVEPATVDLYVASLVSGQPASPADRVAVLRLLEGLDQKAWVVEDAMDAGNATVRDYEAAFNQARAVNALLFALDADAAIAAQESVYEAQAATNDLPAIRRMVDEVAPEPL